MRVWALASCSGLLALAACSAEQTNSPDLGTAPPDTDDPAQTTAQPGLRATASSPMARPELRPQQRGGNQARFSPRSPQSTPQASQVSGAGPTLPQADQLRERLQRLRAQHGSRLSPNTPLATTPLPAALTSTPPRPVPQAAADQTSETLSALPPDAIASPGLAPSLRPAGVTALPTLPQPNVARPNVAAPELGLTSTASTAIDLGPVGSVSQTRSYPTAPVQHQGYSTRSQQPAPTLTAASTESSGGLTARLHGTTPNLPSGDLSAVAAAQPLPLPELPEAAAPAETAAPEATPEAVIAGGPLALGAVRSAPAAERDPATAHQANATATLTLTPQRVATSALAALAYHSQGIAARPETAIAPPESLPLNQGTPRLSPLRPTAAVTSPGAASAAAPPVLESQSTEVQASETEASEVQIPEFQTPEAQTPEAQTPSAAFSAHHDQFQLESLSLSLQPEASLKDLPAAYCLQVSGLPLTPETQPETQLEFDPQRADQPPDQLTAAIHLGSAEAALALGERLSKAQAAANCLVENRAAAEPAANEAGPELTWNETLD